MNVSTRKKIISCISLILGFVLVPLFTKILNINTMSSVSAGFAWEIVSTIQKMDNEKQNEYLTYLDEIGSEGLTKSAIEKSTYQSVNPMITAISYANLSNEGHPSIVLKKYVNLILKEPKYYFDMKFEFLSLNLGIKQPLRYTEYNYNRFDKMKQYNYNDSKRRHQFVNLYENFVNTLSFLLLRPWVIFLISIILVAISYVKKVKKSNTYFLVLMLSIFYYGAYIINTQSFEIRYFYPSLYLCLILDVAILMDFVFHMYIHHKKNLQNKDIYKYKKIV